MRERNQKSDSICNNNFSAKTAPKPRQNRAKTAPKPRPPTALTFKMEVQNVKLIEKSIATGKLNENGLFGVDIVAKFGWLL